MNNAERLAKDIITKQTKGIIIHTIPRTNYWFTCQKITQKEWFITLLHPDKRIQYQLGIITEENRLNIWEALTKAELKDKISQNNIATKYKQIIRNFKLRQQKTYAYFLKKEKAKNSTIRRTTSRQTKSNNHLRTNSRSPL